MITERQWFSQNGEDQILAQIFANISEGTCVEVGAFDGLEMSNTAYFESKGWKTLLVEANPDLAEKCRQNRPKANVVNKAAVAPGSPSEVTFEVAESMTGMSSLQIDTNNQRRIKGLLGEVAIRKITITASPLDCILEEAHFHRLDFISIDVEGFEWDVLQGFHIQKWDPSVVLIERLGIFPQYQVLNYFRKNGYELSRRTGDNDWFSRREVGQQGWIPMVLINYLIPLPVGLPKAMYRLFKNILYRLGIYSWFR